MKTEHEQKQIRIPEFTDFPEYLPVRDRLTELRAEVAQAETRVKEIRVLLTGRPTVFSKIKQQAAALLKLTSEPTVDYEKLEHEFSALVEKIPVLREAVQLQTSELRKIESILRPSINEAVVDRYNEEARLIAEELLAAGKRNRRLRWILEELRNRDALCSHIVRPFELSDPLNLDEDHSWLNRSFRELQEYGVTVEGWEDPIQTKQPQPGQRRKVRLLGTAAGPQGVQPAGTIVNSEYADFLITSRQAVEIGDIEARRARLDALPA